MGIWMDRRGNGMPLVPPSSDALLRPRIHLIGNCGHKILYNKCSPPFKICNMNGWIQHNFTGNCLAPPKSRAPGRPHILMRQQHRMPSFHVHVYSIFISFRWLVPPAAAGRPALWKQNKKQSFRSVFATSLCCNMLTCGRSVID